MKDILYIEPERLVKLEDRLQQVKHIGVIRYQNEATMLSDIDTELWQMGFISFAGQPTKLTLTEKGKQISVLDEFSILCEKEIKKQVKPTDLTDLISKQLRVLHLQLQAQPKSLRVKEGVNMAWTAVIMVIILAVYVIFFK